MYVSYCLFEVGEVTLIRPELVHEAMEKVRLIRERLKMAQSRQSHKPMLEEEI